MRSYDLIVIGAGPGGYVAAARAARAGLKTALIEREHLGGVCLNWGCIPTKALLHSAHLWRAMQGARKFGLQAEGLSFDYAAIQRRSRQTVTRLTKGVELLFKNLGVDVVMGTAAVAGRDGEVLRVAVGDELLGAPHVILATGGRTRALPALPFDGERIIGSREALALTAVPARLLVVGSGAIGLEFADLFASFGAKVTVVEILPQILPTEDQEVSVALRSALAKRGIKILTGTEVSGVRKEADALHCTVGENELAIDTILVAVGVAGDTEGLGLETVDLTPERSFLPVDGHLRTAVAGLYAIGDLTGPPLLAHVASAQGIIAAEHAAGLDPAPYDSRWVPGAIFTHPQVASVGLREQDLAEDQPVKIGRFPYSASGKAVAEGEVTGFVKVLLDGMDDTLLGAHIIGSVASELIPELTLTATAGLTARDLLRAIHAHPTLAEAIPEAFGAALDQAIHG